MAKVRWGVLGCANFARGRTIPAMLDSPSVELVGVASRSLERAEEFRSHFNLPRAYGSYEEMLDDPTIQAVYNPLPPAVRPEWMIKAAVKGKHTLAEKPFAGDAAAAQQVADAAARTGVSIMEAFMWRFHPQHERARQAIRNGAIGPVRLVRAAFTFTIARQPNIRLDPAMAGGSVMDVGCYTISGTRFYYEEEPVSVYARGAFDPEYDVDMSMAGVLEYPQGLAVIDCGFHVPYRADMEIVGDKGTIQIPSAWIPPEEATLVINGQEEKLPSAFEYVNEFEHFSQCVLSGTPPRYGPEDAVRQMKVVDAVRRSMRSGQPERV